MTTIIDSPTKQIGLALSDRDWHRLTLAAGRRQMSVAELIQHWLQMRLTGESFPPPSA